MRFRLGPRTLTLLLLLACAGTVGGIWYFRSVATPAPAKLVRYLPPTSTVVLSIDVASIRNAGVLDMLAGSPANEEQDYLDFKVVTDFDYLTDLDHILASFKGNRTFALLTGRFNWPELARYATLHDGQCRDGHCQMPASQNGRYISYYPLRSRVLALGIGPDEWAAREIGDEQSSWMPAPQRDRLAWLSVSRSAMKNSEGLGSLGMLLKLVEGATRADLSLAGRDGDLAIEMTAICEKPADAARIEKNFYEATRQLREQAAKDSAGSSEGTLAGVLTTGEFTTTGNVASGRWRADRRFVEALAGGKL